MKKVYKYKGTNNKYYDLVADIIYGRNLQVCPACKHVETRRGISGKKNRYQYLCTGCQHMFTVLSGTIFNMTNTSLDKWAEAYKIVQNTNGEIWGQGLADMLGIGHSAANSILNKIERADELDIIILQGLVKVLNIKDRECLKMARRNRSKAISRNFACLYTNIKRDFIKCFEAIGFLNSLAMADACIRIYNSLEDAKIEWGLNVKDGYSGFTFRQGHSLFKIIAKPEDGVFFSIECLYKGGYIEFREELDEGLEDRLYNRFKDALDSSKSEWVYV